MDVKKISRAALYVAIAIALAGVGFRFLLPILLPFFIGFLLSRAAEPIIRALQKNKTLPRWVCSAASMVLIYVVLGVVLGRLSLISNLLSKSLSSKPVPAGVDDTCLVYAICSNWSNWCTT